MAKKAKNGKLIAVVDGAFVKNGRHSTEFNKVSEGGCGISFYRLTYGPQPTVHPLALYYCAFGRYKESSNETELTGMQLAMRLAIAENLGPIDQIHCDSETDVDRMRTFFRSSAKNHTGIPVSVQKGLRAYLRQYAAPEVFHLGREHPVIEIVDMVAKSARTEDDIGLKRMELTKAHKFYMRHAAMVMKVPKEPKNPKKKKDTTPPHYFFEPPEAGYSTLQAA